MHGKDKTVWHLVSENMPDRPGEYIVYAAPKTRGSFGFVGVATFDPRSSRLWGLISPEFDKRITHWTYKPNV